MKKVIVLLTLVGLASCQREITSTAPAADCLVTASATSGDIIEGEYIITLKEASSTSSTTARIAAVSDQLRQQYNLSSKAIRTTFKGHREGFFASLTPAELHSLQTDPSIELVEPDRKIGLCSCLEVVSSTSVTWNVRKTGYGNGENFQEKTVWVIDTGVDLDHPDLNIDTQRSQSFISGITTAEDNNGHGTHVAGIIGAKNNTLGVMGVASGAKIVALKVLDQLGEGRLSSVISALTYIRQNGKAGDVVNMSLGLEGISTTLDREVQAAANLGILFSIAAGNDAKLASGFSPARLNHSNIFTVSAVDSTGRFASFSNYGNDAVDVAAYGVRILSTYSNGRYAILSGTSMAAPHVAGLLLIKGINIPTSGTASNDPDGVPDPIARAGKTQVAVAVVDN